MNKIFLNTLAIFFSLLMYIGCKEDTVDFIASEDMAITLTGDRTIQKVELPSSGTSDQWHIYSPTSDSWLTFEAVKGESAVIVSVQDNGGNEQRTSYIMVEHGNTAQKIIVTQDILRQLTLSKDQLRMRYVQYTDEVVVGMEGFKELKIEINEADKSWLSTSLNDNTVTVTTKANPLEVARESTILISAIESLTGVKRTKQLTVIQGQGGLTPYVFDVPDFSESKVYKVMDGDKQVAQIAKEYLFTKGMINSQAIVVYPVSKDGSVELHKGYVAQVLLDNKDLSDVTYNFVAPTGKVHGGSISFSIESQSIKSYTPGNLSEPVTKVYMPGDIEMGPDKIEGSKPANTEPYLVEDIRKDETNHYPIVKIGTQYWIGKNLNTIHYNNNKAYESIPTGAVSTEERTAASYSIWGYRDGTSTEPGAITNRERYGFLYSYLTIGGFNTVAESNLTKAGDIIVDNISPEGWIVPTIEEVQDLRTYLNSSFLRLRKFMDYGQDKQVFPVPTRKSDENITGFDAPNGSYRNTSGGYTALGSDSGSWMLSRTFQGGEAGSEAIAMFHLLSIQTSQPIPRQFSIRCMNDKAIKIVD